MSKWQILLWAILISAMVLASILSPSELRDGIWINLLTEVMGIYATVFIVDRLLDAHEKSRWSIVDELVDARMRQLAMSAITRVRLGFGVKMTDLMTLQDRRATGDQDGLFLQRIQSNLEPTVQRKAHQLRPEQWAKVDAAMYDLGEGSDHLISMFSHRISPEDHSRLMELNELARAIAARFEILPEAFDGSEPANQFDEDLYHGMVDDVGTRLQQLLASLRELASAHIADAPRAR